MLHFNAPQGSEQWLQDRLGVITASRYKDARDRNKPAKGETIGKPSAKCVAYAAQVAVERIAQRPVERAFENWQMREGSEQEPHARAAYDVETGNIVTEAGLITTDDRLFGYSPDGLIGEDGLLEIKTLLSPDVIVRVIGDGDLSAYMDQCIGGLWLTGRQWIDLVLWAPALAPIGRQLTIHRITRNEDAIESLEADLLAFAAMVRDAETKLRKDDAQAVAEVVAEIEAAGAAEASPPAPTPAPAVIAPPAPVSASPNVVPMPSPVPRATSQKATLTVGAVCARLGEGCTLTRDFIVKTLGVSGQPGERAGTVMFTEDDFQCIGESFKAHITTAQAKQLQAA